MLYASLISWLFLVVLQLYKGQLKQTLTCWKDYPHALLFGAINPFIYYLMLLKAYTLLPAQEAQILNYTWALTMTLLAIPLLGHKPGRFDIVAAVLCYLGVVVIATRGDLLNLEFGSLMGVGGALLSTVIWALYWLLNTRHNHDPMAGLLRNFTCALPMIVVYCVVTKTPLIISWQGFSGALYIGLFEMGISFVCWQMAMRLTESTARIANLIFIAPLLSLVIISVILKEPILSSTLWGMVLILGGLMTQQMFSKEKQA